MTGEKRRELILSHIKDADIPISGSELAKHFQVSRQVIVQDIALLRVADYNIVATNKGYVLNTAGDTDTPRRILKVRHSSDDILDELYTFVDHGARILNVFVNHKIYGRVEAPMNIKSRRDANLFLNDIKSGKSTPLMNITSGYHYHTIEADSEEILDDVENALKEKKYLII
ncbi:transcriptional regulator of NAD metabolism [Aequitasia blattaphilus]|uniref:Transcription repressor NadR n=1 Tax=Aequitasia blattaphilus TaxID=2949332 RepID=A0ABT1E520_9FIRM|nr:transcription repressor NadR [Aequitasia blattaphilus]MCP1100919.1 transcription repressor NadR [Aequitasia blattaphilus]MCR8613559.1 transcription repressor NadR [Aequitasia blattaphilus]